MLLMLMFVVGGAGCCGLLLFVFDIVDGRVGSCVVGCWFLLSFAGCGVLLFGVLLSLMYLCVVCVVCFCLMMLLCVVVAY